VLTRASLTIVHRDPGSRAGGARGILALRSLVVLCELSTFVGVDNCERKDRDHHGGERAE
jgi:hypothetical protein